jgi:DNA-binding NarL/FixJ family response regulator
MDSLRILVVDDHELIRRGIRELLAARPDWQVVAEAANGHDAVRLSEELNPDIVILDLSMPGMNGIEAARQIVRLGADTEIILLTMHDTDDIIRQALTSGARGFVLKSDADRDLIDAVEMVAKHRQFLTSRVATLVLNGYLSSGTAPTQPVPDSRLTTREREIVQLLAAGQTSRQIADQLSISIRTTETHRVNINRKLSLKSIADLVRYAVRHGLIATI